MVNNIYFNLNRGDDTDSLSTSSGFSSSRRSDFPDDEETQRRNPSSSVYSTIGKRFRSWVRSPLPPGPLKIGPIESPTIPWGKGSIQREAPVGSVASITLRPPEIIPSEDLAISLEELNKLTGDFGRSSLVGRGSNSQVFRATLNTGEVAAVKKLFICLPEEPNFDFAAKLLEVSRLQHDNVLKLLRYCLVSNNRILVHDFATMGSLHEILHGRKGIEGSEPGSVLTWNQRVKIAFGAAVGLAYVHNEGIVHGAINSRSILIFDDFVSKIADLCRSNKDPYGYFIPPKQSEVHPYLLPLGDGPILHEPSTQKSDVYRFGAVLLELLTGRKAVDRTMPGSEDLVSWATPRLSEHKVHQCMDPKLNTDYPPKAAAKLAAIAGLCLQYEPEFRPHMDIVVKRMRPLLKVGETSNSVLSPRAPSFT